MSPAPVVSTSLAIGKAGTSMRLVAVDDDAALLRPRHDSKHALGPQLVERLGEIRRFVQRQHFVGVGEDRVDGLARIRSMNSPRNRSTQNESESVRATRRPAARAISRRLLERRLGRRPVPHIAFEIDDLRRLDQGLVDVGRRQEGARAEIGVHRALAVGRHIDEAASGRRALLRGRGREMTPVERMSSANAAPSGSSLDLADIGARARRTRRRRRSCWRPTRPKSSRIDAGGVERLGAILVDERHRALQHLLRDEIVVIGVCAR